MWLLLVIVEFYLGFQWKSHVLGKFHAPCFRASLIKVDAQAYKKGQKGGCTVAWNTAASADFPQAVLNLKTPEKNDGIAIPGIWSLVCVFLRARRVAFWTKKMFCWVSLIYLKHSNAHDDSMNSDSIIFCQVWCNVSLKMYEALQKINKSCCSKMLCQSCPGKQV